MTLTNIGLASTQRQNVGENKATSLHKHVIRYSKELPPHQFKMKLAYIAITADRKIGVRFKNSYFTTHQAILDLQFKHKKRSGSRIRTALKY